MADKKRAQKDSSSEEGQEITRRDFIKKALITTAYVVPVITTFSAKDLMAQGTGPQQRPVPPPPPSPAQPFE
ncbi:MAG: hypothetical protein DRQ24_08645 [Candidatus Latescibacterota bacterium]|nr:MAG: hypothetical protein DRQ24_08645 [Candidatus Latescibacterota bacterium]